MTVLMRSVLRRRRVDDMVNIPCVEVLCGEGMSE
jgi:hypothetical protein